MYVLQSRQKDIGGPLPQAVNASEPKPRGGYPVVHGASHGYSGKLLFPAPAKERC